MYKEIPLSHSTDGKGILISGTNTAGAVDIHTATSDTVKVDQIFGYAQNNHTGDVVLSLEYGENTGAKAIKVTLPAQKGLQLVLPGIVLRNSAIIKAFASVANVVTIFGSVGRDE